ncbi:MAG: galactokinase [Chloroflexi bacterium]|nr:galactokinase [Chloroflexota bacterium]
MPSAAAELFRATYGREPEVVVRAPGRVNLIGEHTDYNGGFVLPAAIDLSLELAASAALAGARTRTVSREAADASRYVEAVRRALGSSTEMDVAIASDVPAGAGLSSSAALELATARAVQVLEGREWDAQAMALACTLAENEYVGNRCGVMDQMVVALGRARDALLIDCEAVSLRHVPVQEEVALVVCDSAKPRALVESAYNQRRAACEAAARALGVRSLRRANPAMLDGLPEALRKRARHVVHENARVLDFVAALERGDLAPAGRLMDDSHASLRDLYEVSCAELDLLVDLAHSLDGCYGSRLTGAGFGGCTVSLVEAGKAAEFGEELAARYRERSGLAGRAWVVRPADGVRIIPN